MNELIKLKIDLYCEMVQKGKPCACEAIQERYFEEVNVVINTYNLKTYSENLAVGWKTIWIYKDDYMLDIIKSLPNEPKTSYEHWICGKAFGYSDESIKEFIEGLKKVETSDSQDNNSFLLTEEDIKEATTRYEKDSSRLLISHMSEWQKYKSKYSRILMDAKNFIRKNR